MNNAIQYMNLNQLIPGEFQNHLECTNKNIDNLTKSIKEYGILEPLIVRKKDDKYEIILGNRRYKAAKNLGFETVPVIVLNIDESKTLELLISDKIERKEISPKEEAYLYDKALSNPNTTLEKLSINLGIPLDRITSKLNLLRKSKNENNKDLSLKNEELTSREILNSSINNDIVNLSKLNKKEEREDYNMNNNQFMTSDNTQNTMNTQAPLQTPQEPTFGGRFFPSLEDEPTNMNLNGIIGMASTPGSQSEIPQTAPLIDLTDLSTTEQPNNINIIPTPVNPIQENIGMPSLEQANMGMNVTEQPLSMMPETPNIPQMDEPINISNLIQQSPIENNFNNNLSSIQHPQESVQNIEPMMSMGQPPVQEPVQNIEPMMPIGQQPVQEPVQNVEPMMPMGQPPVQEPVQNVEPMMPIDQPPVQEPVQSMEPPMPQTILMDNQFNQPIDINNTSETTNQKDVLPVANIIKNMAISLEAFGYKLNITESDQGPKYNITIEIEK